MLHLGSVLNPSRLFRVLPFPGTFLFTTGPHPSAGLAFPFAATRQAGPNPSGRSSPPAFLERKPRLREVQ